MHHMHKHRHQKSCRRTSECRTHQRNHVSPRGERLCPHHDQRAGETNRGAEKSQERGYLRNGLEHRQTPGEAAQLHARRYLRRFANRRGGFVPTANGRRHDAGHGNRRIIANGKSLAVAPLSDKVLHARHEIRIGDMRPAQIEEPQKENHRRRRSYDCDRPQNRAAGQQN